MGRILNPAVYFVLAVFAALAALLASEGASNAKDLGLPVALGAISAGLFVGAAVLKKNERAG